MAGLVPAIHVFDTREEDVDARHKAGHDDKIDDVMSLPSEVDVAIIGAGAAGLGAAHALKQSNLSCIVLEARDRVGGRAHTIQAAPDITFDLGCGWLHSADKNSFVAIAERLNFEIDQSHPPWREQSFGTSSRQKSAPSSSQRSMSSSVASRRPQQAATTAPPTSILSLVTAGTR